jgi:hypothetical protein
MGEWEFLDIPSVVPQETERLCWAAALESWLGIVPNRPAYDQDFLVLEGRLGHHVTDEGDLKKKGLIWIAQTYGMAMKTFPYHHRLSLHYLLGRLKTRGHVYLGFHQHSAGKIGHALVVWGVDEDDDEVHVMDPWHGRGLTVYAYSSFYAEPTEFIVGWPYP